MGTQKSFLKIEGTVEGLSFYKGADGVHYVRSKGGVSKDRIKTDAAFRRTRENGAEFGEVARSGKLFRKSIQDLLFDVRDRTRSNRMMSVLTQVKNDDLTSDRGARKVYVGMQTPAGKGHFNLFEFNQNAPLDRVLKANYTLDTTAGSVTIPNFVPLMNLELPQGATHVSLQAAWLRFDFETGVADLVPSNVEQLVVDENPNSISLAFATTPSGPGLDYYFLKVSFYQQINAKLYALQNGAFNALQLIAIE